MLSLVIFYLVSVVNLINKSYSIIHFYTKVLKLSSLIKKKKIIIINKIFEAILKIIII